MYPCCHVCIYIVLKQKKRKLNFKNLINTSKVSLLPFTHLKLKYSFKQGTGHFLPCLCFNATKSAVADKNLNLFFIPISPPSSIRRGQPALWGQDLQVRRQGGPGGRDVRRRVPHQRSKVVQERRRRLRTLRTRGLLPQRRSPAARVPSLARCSQRAGQVHQVRRI